MLDDPDQDIGDHNRDTQDNIQRENVPRRSEVHILETVTISLWCTRICEAK